MSKDGGDLESLILVGRASVSFGSGHLSRPLFTGHPVDFEYFKIGRVFIGVHYSHFASGELDPEMTKV